MIFCRWQRSGLTEDNKWVTMIDSENIDYRGIEQNEARNCEWVVKYLPGKIN
jgi:hypothetical protein